jgi:hypothetical protein
MLSGAGAAQQARQFLNVPEVELTGGQVASFLAGAFQRPANLTDILYIGAPTGSGITSSISVGAMLNQGGPGFTRLGLNKIDFHNVSNVVAALADFDGDLNLDFAFALTPTVPGSPNLCVYYGTGVILADAIASGQSSFSGGNAYPPTSENSGCTTFPVLAGGVAPNFSYIAASPLKLGLSLPPQLFIEDSVNNVLYILRNNGLAGSSGALKTFTVLQQILLPTADGAGPIYFGDFDNDGNIDFIVNGQKGASATVYFGDGAGTFKRTARYTFDNNVHSMLLQDMNRDGHPDMVVEGDKGVIEIFQGNPDGTFATKSIGGTRAGFDGFSGNGGHLAAINPISLDILTTTPIGMSLLQANGALTYFLKEIYNIGPSRTSYAMADFFGAGNLDFAVDSPEGVAIVLAKSDGTFLTTKAYAALQPALGAVVGKFRSTNNPNGYPDVVVATGPAQAQLMTGNGDATFNTFPGQVNRFGTPSTIPPGMWANILGGDFSGDGNLDVAYSLTGLPLPVGTAGGPGLYLELGRGDGTFGSTVAITSASMGAPSGNNFYGESVAGDLNGDGIADLANIDGGYDDTLLGERLIGPLFLGFNQPDNSNTAFDQVAAGFFKTGRASKQDLIFQEGANLFPYKNSGDGINFTRMPALANPAAPPQYVSTLLLTDVDGDGNGDVVAVYYNTLPNPVGAGPVAPNLVYIWYGNGDGTFIAPQILNLSRNYYLGAVADMNGDGQPDIILSDGSLISILYNQGGRSFYTTLANGQLALNESHFLAGQGINSISLVDVNGDGEPDIIVANGGVTISNVLALGGKTAASISLTPNPVVNTGGITVLANNITTKPVTGTLTATPEPSNFAATFTLTAALFSAPGVALPTGSVQFTIDGNPVGTPVIVVPGTNNSTATYTVAAGNTYLAGPHSLTADYIGDTANSPITLSATHAIVGGTTTTELLLCVGPTAACPSIGFVSPPFQPLIPMMYGQTYNGTASVTASDNGPLPGNTLFYDAYNGAAPLLLCRLITSIGGSCPPSVGTGAQVGTHIFTAVYDPGTLDTIHTGSTSPTVTIVVTQDTDSANLIGTPNPSPAGQLVTFTAILTGTNAPLAAAGSPFPYQPAAGPVVFTFGATKLGTSILVPSASGLSSTATLTTSALPVGSDLITATYAGTLDFAATSATFLETITPSISGSFTLTVTPTPVSVGVGYSSLFTVKVTGQNGFAQGVNLTCGNLPNEATCFFDNAQIAAGGGSTFLLVQTTAPHSCGTTQPYFLGGNGGNGGAPGATPFVLPALASLLVLFLPGRRRWLRVLAVLIVVAGATQITGCGHCSDLGTRPATYTFQVTGSSTGTSEVHSQPVTITVTI